MNKITIKEAVLRKQELEKALNWIYNEKENLSLKESLARVDNEILYFENATDLKVTEIREDLNGYWVANIEFN